MAAEIVVYPLRGDDAQTVHSARFLAVFVDVAVSGDVVPPFHVSLMMMTGAYPHQNS